MSSDQVGARPAVTALVTPAPNQSVNALWEVANSEKASSGFIDDIVEAWQNPGTKPTRCTTVCVGHIPSTGATPIEPKPLPSDLALPLRGAGIGESRGPPTLAR